MQKTLYLADLSILVENLSFFNVHFFVENNGKIAENLSILTEKSQHFFFAEYLSITTENLSNFCLKSQ